MEKYPSNGQQSVHHIAGGRRLGTKDYKDADESKHLNEEDRKDSHFKADFLLPD